MAMTMTGEVQLPASRETVWAKLNDPETLKVCIPGCQELNMLSETEFEAVAVNKIGPVKAKFKGRVTLSDLDPPNGYKISGQGDGGVAGFAKGGAAVALTEKDGGTLLTYNVEAQIGGKGFSAQSIGSMFGVYFRDTPPASFAEVMQCDRERFNRFFHAMLARGVYLAPSAYEAGFVSAAHSAADIDATLAAAREAFKPGTA